MTSRVAGAGARDRDGPRAAESAAARGSSSGLPDVWQTDARPPIDGDVVRMIAGIRVHRIHGVDFLSTSSVLSLSPWGRTSHVPPAALEYGATRGKYVDIACQWLEQGTLDMDALDPKLLPYVQSWAHWLATAKPEIYATEELVLNDRIGVLGYVDRRCRLYDPVLHFLAEAIVDLKTSAHIGMRDRLQLAAYAFKGERRVVVQATKTGKPVIHEFTEPHDAARFAALAAEAHAWIREEETRSR